MGLDYRLGLLHTWNQGETDPFINQDEIEDLPQICVVWLANLTSHTTIFIYSSWVIARMIRLINVSSSLKLK